MNLSLTARQYLGCKLSLVVIVIGCTPKTKTNRNEHSASPLVGLEVSKSINMGIVARGSKSQHAFLIKNLLKKQQFVEKFDISCDCLFVDPKSILLKPGGVTETTFFLDLNHSPNFEGPLSIMVKGIGEQSKTLFDTTVNVTVGVQR